MKRLLIVTFALLLPFVATSCNTIQGIGMDIQDGGKALSNAMGGSSSSDKNQSNQH